MYSGCSVLEYVLLNSTLYCLTHAQTKLINFILFCFSSTIHNLNRWHYIYLVNFPCFFLGSPIAPGKRVLLQLCLYLQIKSLWDQGDMPSESAPPSRPHSVARILEISTHIIQLAPMVCSGLFPRSVFPKPDHIVSSCTLVYEGFVELWIDILAVVSMPCKAV